MLSCSGYLTKLCKSTSKITQRLCSVLRRRLSPMWTNAEKEAPTHWTQLWSLQTWRWLSALSTQKTSSLICWTKMLVTWTANKSNQLLMVLGQMDLEIQSPSSRVNQSQHSLLVHRSKAVPQQVPKKEKLCLLILLGTTDRAMEQLHWKSCSDRLNRI